MTEPCLQLSWLSTAWPPERASGCEANMTEWPKRGITPARDALWPKYNFFPELTLWKERL